MGAIQLPDFDREFIERTRKLNSTYRGSYTITLLLNSLLALIVLPNEFIKKRKMSFAALSKKIQSIPEIAPLTPNSDTSLRNFLRLIRNGIAHQNVAPINHNEKWVAVEIWNINQLKVEDFRVRLTIKQLRVLCRYVSEQYIAAITSITK